MSAARVRLTFHADLVREPVIARLARTFDVLPNLRRASVEETVGWIVCELDGPPDQIEAAIAWLVEQGVEVDPLGDVVES
jgi:L-aspartate semialdehyde sulfurtransferase ferredoxin